MASKTEPKTTSTYEANPTYPEGFVPHPKLTFWQAFWRGFKKSFKRKV